MVRHRLRCWLFTVRMAVVPVAMVAALAPLSRLADASELRRSAIVRAVEEARPSVVNIHGRKTVRADAASFGQVDQFRQVNGMGTGVVVDERGYILTNYHVVEGVGRIQVTMADRQTHIARLVAHDAKTDLAIIKINVEQPLPTLRVGASGDLMTGEEVIAIGNAYGYEHTITRGIISALNRSVQVSDEQKYDNLIQTDASINPGNSGGPLLNIDGDLIGINVAVRVGAQGIGFAIPIDDAMAIAARLLSAERLENTWHGVRGETRGLGEQRRFVVTSVEKGSPAEKAGLKAGDVLQMLDGRPIAWALDIERALLERRERQELPLVVQRGGDTQSLTLAVSKAPSAADTLADRVWSELGLRLKTAPSATFRQVSTRYRGGLEVSAVRGDSPAAEQGIQPGDILVGMHVWETISLDNVAYVLNHNDLEQLQPIKFYIVRGSETLYGHLRVASVK